MTAAFEGVFADGDLRWEEWCAEVSAVEESVGADSAKGVVPLHFAQASALTERTIFNLLERGVELHFLQVDTLGKSRALESLQRCRQLHLFEHLAFHERAFFNHMDMVHEVDTSQLLAVMESTNADAERGERYIDALEGETSVQSFIADGVESFGQVESVESRAALEDLFGEGTDAVRNDDLT